MQRCDVQLWSSADPDSNFLNWVKTGMWNRFFFSEYSRFICWCRLQNLSGSAAVLQSSTSQYSIWLWSACGPDASPLKGANESTALCLLKQLYFFSYIMVMCVVSNIASINKNIKLTEKLFIASFCKKELVNIILLHWFAAISANF